MPTWTTPRTWVDGETPTAALFNAQVKGNLEVLAVSRAEDGRIAALAATTLADLSSTNLTGLARPNAANTFTVGQTSFAVARMRIPVGVDKYAGTSGAKTPGSLWTEGDYLYYVDVNGKRWRYLGALVDASPSVGAGELAISGTEIHYVSETGAHRACWSTFQREADPSTPYGTFGWDGEYLRLVDNVHAVRYLYSPAHINTPHSNVDGTPHANVDHVNSDPPHTNVEHNNYDHYNIPEDYYGPGNPPQHDNVDHTNILHTNTDPPHTNTDHSNTPEVPHENTEAVDSPGLDQPTKVDA